MLIHQLLHTDGEIINLIAQAITLKVFIRNGMRLIKRLRVTVVARAA